MSKWEDSFNQNKISKNHCYCNDNDGLFVPNRQLSIVIAGLLFLFFGFFIVGYFLGKRSAVEQFTQNMYQESLSDQTYTSIVITNDIQKPDSSSPINTDTRENEKNVINQDSITSPIVILDNNENENTGLLQEENIFPKIQFYAQLIGFGTEKAAQKFVQKLALKNIETFVKKRSSKTTKGKTIYWYQVVTPPYDNKETLTALVNRLAKEERLSGIYIGSYS